MAFFAFLFLSTHLTFQTTVRVPNLVELTTTQAKTALQKLGLKLGLVDSGDSLLPTGEIFEQTPAVGAISFPGRYVNVVISRQIGLTGPQNRPVKTTQLPSGLTPPPHLPPGELIAKYKPAIKGKSLWCLPHLVVAPNHPFLSASNGAKVTLIAEGLHHPRNLAEAPNGDIFVVESRIEIGQEIQPNRVVVVRPGLRHPVIAIWADKLFLPFGIRFYRGDLYVANTGSIVRWHYKLGDTKPHSSPEVVYDKIPERGMRQHWTRNILFDDAHHKLYITIGSKANVAIEEPVRATILAVKLQSDGTLTGPATIFAGGMRNPVGLDLNPVNGNLMACVNERDYLGDELVPDYATEVHKGDHFGWPWFWMGKHRDLRVPTPSRVPAGLRLPDLVFRSHSAPIGLVATRKAVYVALHGSQNRADPVGYSIVRIPLNPKSGAFAGPPKTFVSGWMIGYKGRKVYVYGRPAGLALSHSGDLLIADDWGGRIWRVELPANEN